MLKHNTNNDKQTITYTYTLETSYVIMITIAKITHRREKDIDTDK